MYSVTALFLESLITAHRYIKTQMENVHFFYISRINSNPDTCPISAGISAYFKGH